MGSLCLIEDDPIMGESLQERFRLEGFSVDWFDQAMPAAAALERNRYDAVISDVRLPDLSGEDVFQRRRSAAAGCPPFLFITAYATVDRAVAMLQQGACDYITKPFDINELVGKVRRIVRPPDAAGEAAPHPAFAMRSIESQLPRIALRARMVLITGESGVGKEVLARRLHGLAPPGPAAPFVAVNCGAIPEPLVESVLFGHERGAFTGADRARKGCFEQADGGTLFLDEIGELPPPIQVRLLRVLQERTVQRLGAERSLPVDVRVTCATHVDLGKAVAEGRFREDLYYRINVVQLHVPALRDRPDELLDLARTLLREQAVLQSEPPRELSPGARTAALAHTWPGNVRELRNRLERACVLTDRRVLEAGDLFEASTPAVEPTAGPLPRLDRFLDDAERDYLRAALARFDGRVGATAAALGISRKALWEKCKRLGLRSDGS